MNICFPWPRPSTRAEFVPVNTSSKTVDVNPGTVDANTSSVAFGALRTSKAIRYAFIPPALRADSLSTSTKSNSSELTSRSGSPLPIESRHDIPSTTLLRTPSPITAGTRPLAPAASNPIPIPKPNAVFNPAKNSDQAPRIHRNHSEIFSESEFMGRLSL